MRFAVIKLLNEHRMSSYDFRRDCWLETLFFGSFSSLNHSVVEQ
jgi:hypothetical protein